MSTIRCNTNELRALADTIHAGDRVILSGVVYTSRDAAHKRIFEWMREGRQLPYDLQDAVIYYAGPTPTPLGLAIGSCGPTTSGRMDVYTPRLLDLGVAATIGKGGRSAEVCDAIVRNHSVYLCAVGGAGALACKHITSCEVIGFEDLGCESVKRLEFRGFPLIAAIDCSGGNLFQE